MTRIAQRYELMGELGAGVTAVVYRAHDTRLRRDVAIKVLRDEFRAGLASERFEREIKVLERLQHPHIISLLDRGLTGDHAFLVMPVASDGTLEDRLRREGPLSLTVVRRIATELTGALSYAHAAAVVHRDIKPSNILISGDHFWLADFGIVALLMASEASRLTPSGITLGSQEYMSPEQLLGDEAVDHRSDIYSLGLVLYEAAAGIHAFPARTAQASANMRLMTNPVPVRGHRPDIDQALEVTISRALRSATLERWSSSEEMGASVLNKAWQK